MNTLLLDQQRWDLCVDASGNIAMASDPYSLAQDAASAIRLFRGEYWFDTTQGVPYVASIFGQTPIPLAYIKSQLVAAALTVPEVTAAQVFISGISGRKLTGQVQIQQGGVVVSAAQFGG